MTSEVDQLYQRSRSTFFMCNILFISHPKFSSGWDPSGSIKIFCSLTRFFFRVGSVRIDQDLSLCDQISLRGGISYFHLDDFFLPSAASIKELFVSIRFFNILSMPQVFEQSLFLFIFRINLKELGSGANQNSCGMSSRICSPPWSETGSAPPNEVQPTMPGWEEEAKEERE